MSLDNGERNEAAKVRREATEVEVMEPWSIFPRDTSFARFFLGQQPAILDSTVYLTAGPRSRVLWIREDLRRSSCLKHANARFESDSFTTRFTVGPWEGDGHLVRCSFVVGTGHCIALPIEPEADEFIRFYRHRSYEEWANETGYRPFHMAEEDEGKERPGPAMVARLKTEGWDARHDPRTGDVWARRKIG